MVGLKWVLVNIIKSAKYQASSISRIRYVTLLQMADWVFKIYLVKLIIAIKTILDSIQKHLTTKECPMVSFNPFLPLTSLLAWTTLVLVDSSQRWTALGRQSWLIRETLRATTLTVPVPHPSWFRWTFASRLPPFGSRSIAWGRLTSSSLKTI